MNTDMKHYNVTPIYRYGEKTNCPFLGIAGGKGNGKTYGIVGLGLFKFIESKYTQPMRYLRRYAESIKPTALQSLCKPQKQDLINLTHGKYNDFKYYQHRFYLVRTENDKVVDKCAQPFMVCNALNSVEANTGADEGECSLIFYDEFLSREKELSDEFYKLMIFHNNCIRNRTNKYTPMFLVGNTVTRNSCLISEFGVNLYDMKQGDITVVRNKKGEPKIVFEYCSAVEVMTESGDEYYKRFDDNDRIKMIYQGDWTVSNYPHLPQQMIKDSTMQARIKIIAPDRRAICFEFRTYANRQLFGYVHSYTDDRLSKICTLLNTSTLTAYDVFNYLPQKGIFKRFIKLVYTNNVYFDTCENGEKFRDFLKNFKGAEKIANCYI